MRVGEALPGTKYARLTIVETFLIPGQRARRALCRCECGRLHSLHVSAIGKTKSCGCWFKELRPGKNSPPSSGEYGSKEYIAVKSAKARCTNPKHKNWDQYGGRGIAFRFSSVLEAARYVASLPGSQNPLSTLDRIDNDEHYERGNLRWATRSEQAQNRTRKGSSQ